MKRRILQFLLIMFLVPVLWAQEEVGLPFLKIGIGARQAGMGGVFSGVGDDVYAMYSNPGALGLIRRWQWSADYNVWFTDVHQATLSGARQFRFLGSRKTTLGVGVSYLGMPEWDATGGVDTPVSVHHLLAGFSVAQRLDWLSHAVSLGANIRGLSSTMGAYDAKGWFVDAGLMIRPPRFELGSWGLGLFDYGIISLGGAIQYLGESIQYNELRTALPRTWRAGASLLAGRYGGWSLLLATDVIGVLKRDVQLALGSEIWWKNILGIRAGYRFNGKDLGDFSFGFGMRWDDIFNSIFDLPSRYGDAFEINVADVPFGEALNQTYRGSFSHYPVAPEPFDLREPNVVTSQVLGEPSVVSLEWENSSDPDPFDKIQYLVMISKDAGLVQRAVSRVERDMPSFLASPMRDSLMICISVPSNVYRSGIVEGGIYYWAVAAYDLGQHARLARRGEKTVDSFLISTADLSVSPIRFEYKRKITTTPEQGVLTLTLSNKGSAPSGPFRIVWKDKVPGASGADSARILLDHSMMKLAAMTDTVFVHHWNTRINGVHVMEVQVDPEGRVLELVKTNNDLKQSVASIPKGFLSSIDSAEVLATGYDYIELPIVPEVYFAPFSSEVDAQYYQDTIYPAVLKAFAERLLENPEVELNILGSVDLLTGEEDPSLAVERAENAKSILIRLGVPEAQLNVILDHDRVFQGRRPIPADSMDARSVMEQNRVVSFEVATQYEEMMFLPFRMAADTTLGNGGIPFTAKIVSPGGISQWRVQGISVPFEIMDMNIVSRDSLWGEFVWDGMDRNGLLVLREHSYRYRLLLVDSLQRTFETDPDSIYISENRTLQKWEMFGAAKFGQIEPVYQFYWDRMMDIARELVENQDMAIRFEGHACAIGSQEINQRLSQRRAERFSEAFKEKVRRAYPNQYQEVWRRVERPRGFGENVPLKVKIRGRGDLLLGDNRSPIGRYLNRRIMVLLYKEN